MPKKISLEGLPPGTKVNIEMPQDGELLPTPHNKNKKIPKPPRLALLATVLTILAALVTMVNIFLPGL